MGSGAKSSGSAGEQVGAPAPDFSLAPVDGGSPIGPKSFAGKVVVVDFWATWCAPCRQSFPVYQHLLEKFPGQLAIVGVSVDDAPDGIAIDKNDNIWICANQEDEIVVIDPTGKVLAKLGDFNGIADDGTHKGFLFPASPAFSADGKYLLVANLALYLPYAGVPVTAIDSQWTLKVKHYSVSRIRAVIPGQGEGDD